MTLKPYLRDRGSQVIYNDRILFFFCKSYSQTFPKVFNSTPSANSFGNTLLRHILVPEGTGLYKIDTFS